MAKFLSRLGAITAIAAAIAGTATIAQTAAAPSWTDATSMVRHGRYVDAIALLRSAAFGPDGSIKNGSAFQLWSQYLPFVTNELPVHTLDVRYATAKLDPDWLAKLAGAKPQDALAEIVTRARKTNIVILNEAHYSPRDRAFALQVARALRPLGYSILAAETFDNWQPGPDGSRPIDRLRRDHIVRLTTGTYTLDPVYAAFVRQALALGYEPVAYEMTAAQAKADDSLKGREEAQANNLMAAIFTAHPTARALIYVGFGHIGERPVGEGGAEFMASRLKRKTGVDPLTIDQTQISDLRPQSRPAYGVAAARINKPAVFFVGHDPLILGDAQDTTAAVDLQVVHPPRRYVDGRAAWLTTLGGKAIGIPTALLPKSGRRLIQIFDKDAPDDAVPLDQVLVEAGKPAPRLRAATANVRFAVQDAPDLGAP